MTFCAAVALVLFVCVTNAAFGQDLTGGVVFLENGKVAYFDFATLQKNISIPMKEPFAVSEEGTTLVRLEDGKALGQRFLPIQTSVVEKWKLSPPFLVFSSKAIQERNVRNLALSPNGKLFAHELQAIGLNYFQTSAPRLNPEHYPETKQINGKNTPLRSGGTDGLPIYDAKTDSFNGINCFFAGITDKSHGGAGEAFFRFGNAVCYKPAHYIAGGSIRGSLLQHSNVLPADSTSQIGCTTGDNEYSREYYKTKHNVFYPAWEKIASTAPDIPNPRHDDMFFAWFCQSIPGEFSGSTVPSDSIEIRIFGSHYGCSSRFSIPLNNGYSTGGNRKCKGLAWKQDRSLTLWTADGNVLEINAENLMEKIRKVWENDLVISQKPGAFVKRITPDGVVIQIEPILVAEGIHATRGTWVSNNVFIFRSDDGALYSWSAKASIKKLRDAIPENWFYVANWPLAPKAPAPRPVIAAQAAAVSP